MSQYEQISKTYNSSDLLKIIASLQLLPQNHGKNIRLVNLLSIALANFNESIVPIPLDELKETINKEFPDSVYEDRPVNLFTENVAFYHGNYIVFPGIKESGTNILNNLLTTIFFSQQNTELPDQFITNVKSAVQLILGLANFSASRFGLTRNYSEKITEKEIKFHSPGKISEYKNAITFNINWVEEYCKTKGIKRDIIEHFIISKDTKPNEYSSLLYKQPIFRIGEEFIFLQLSASVDCLIHYIWSEAKRNNCLEKLLDLYHEYQWLTTERLITQMYGPPFLIDLPSKYLKCKEGIFQFDINKLAYVCFLESGFHDESELDQEKLSESSNQYGKEIEDRQQEIFTFLSEKFEIDDQDFFTIYIISEIGYPQPCILPSSKPNRLNVWFRLSELKRIADLEESDSLLLWKFAKSYTEVINECELHCLGGMLDVFVCYKVNEDSLWPIGEERPGLLGITPGLSQGYVRESILKRDEHLAPIPHHGRIVDVLVYNYCMYAPLYMRVGDISPAPILLKDFPFPIWFFNTQTQTHHHDLIHSHLEGLAFRMIQLKPHIEKYFNSDKITEPIIVDIIFDDRFKMEMRPDDILVVPLENINVPVEILPKQIKLTVPLELAYWYAQSHNEAERLLILTLLNAIIQKKIGINKLQELQNIIDKVIPRGSAKLLTILGNANNIQLETRFLPPYRPIQQYELSRIKINLPSNYGISITQERLSSLKEKKKLCNEITETLYKKLVEKLLIFNQNELLPMLIGWNEACVQKKAAYALDLPAKITAFSSVPNEIFSLIQKEQDRTKTSLAVRFLIELIVAKDSKTGLKQPNVDEIDELIAIAHEMIAWAWLSDGIEMKLYDPKIELFACGRIQVDYSALNTPLIPFSLTRSAIEVNHHIDDYKNIFETPYVETDINVSIEATEIEEAFKSAWGIGLHRLQDFIIDLSNFTRRNNGSVVGIDRSILFEELKKINQKWTDEEINAALNVLVLVSGWEIGKAPAGFKKTDTYPWYYNRALSFVRRPIAKLTRKGEIAYYWSYRSLFSSFDNLLSLFLSGSLQVEEGTALDDLIKKQGTKKGDNFRNAVAGWLKKETELEVNPDEVPIKPGKKLNANTDLGDIDVFAVDHEAGIIYSIECKDTVDSRAIHQMKKEADNYLGRDGESGMIQKHVKRHKWLKENQELLSNYVKNPNSYSIKSLIITSEEIPLAYIKKDKLPMPMISFPNLKIIEKVELRTFLKNVK